MEEAKRARKAETPKQPSRHLRSSAPYFYPDPKIRIEKTILLIRGQKVIIDADLAELYGVTTKALIKQSPETIEGFLRISCSG